MKLTKEQLKATMHIDGPALVLAVPGAGKTTMILNRIINLKDRGISTDRILTITFSKAAAIDMKNRYMIMTNDKGAKFSTIHGFCYSIILDYMRLRGINISLIDSNPKIKYELLKKIYYEVNKSYPTDDRMETAINEISFCKNLFLNPREYEKRRECETLNFEKFFNLYDNYKKENNLIDFDDMITKSVKILNEDDYIRNKYRKRFDYIQLDEGQDTSYAQFLVLKTLAKPKDNFFIVADDDQSIYGFRGASPKYLLNLEKEYKNITKYYMEENFRSSKNIINISNVFIEQNENRFKKTIVTNNPYKEPVNIVKLKNNREEYNFIIEKLKDYKDTKTAILYRNNLCAIGLCEYFERNNIKFNIKDKKNRFFNHFIVQDILNIIEFSKDLSDINKYEKIYYKLNGYISKKHISYLKKNPGKNLFIKLMSYPYLPEYYMKNISNLNRDFKRLKNMNIKSQIAFIENEMGYGEYLKSNANRLGSSYNNLMEYLYYLKLISEDRNDLDEFIGRLKYLDHILREPTNEDYKLTLSTLHSSKGLEFDNVFIVDLVEGTIPSNKSIENLREDPNLYEEERRLFYVGMTRAKKNLYLMYPHTTNNNENKMSSFLLDLETLEGRL